MKKLLLVLVTLSALLVTVSASADQYPTNPYWEEDMRLEQLDWKYKHMLRSYWVKDFRLDITTKPTYDTRGVVEIVPLLDGILDNYTYIAHIYVDALGANRLLYSIRDIQGTTIVLPELLMPAEYSLTVFCTNKDGSGDDRAATCTFVLEPDMAHPTLDEKLSSIVNECRVENDDWQTALNIHDWLTHHANYDNTYSNYGVDGVLYKGTGVCDSYSKAFVMLCETAGISVDRVISNAMNHAWNVVELRGKWYHVDVTWDDSSFDKHTYFCLSNELMYLDHTSSDVSLVAGNGSLDCTSLDANYYIATGTWDYFCMRAALDNSGAPILYSIVNDYIDALNAGETTVTKSWTETITSILDRGDGEWWPFKEDVDERGYAIVAYGLSMRTYALNDGTRVRATATHEPGTDSVTLTVTGEISPIDDPDLRVLILPEDLTTIESQAFAGLTEADAIRIPAGVTSIAPDAFDQDIMLIVPEGSDWVQWAEENGYTCYTY